jgi:hypothetical protein
MARAKGEAGANDAYVWWRRRVLGGERYAKIYPRALDALQVTPERRGAIEVEELRVPVVQI